MNIPSLIMSPICTTNSRKSKERCSLAACVNCKGVEMFPCVHCKGSLRKCYVSAGSKYCREYIKHSLSYDIEGPIVSD